VSGGAPAPVPDLAACVREPKVGWRLAPLRERAKGHGSEQTGYELVLCGRFDAAAQDDDEAAARGLYEGLRTLALEALRPLRVVPAEALFTVEVELTVVWSPAHPDHPQSPAEARRTIAALEDRLRSMGLRTRT
jgi:hypothetical protein